MGRSESDEGDCAGNGISSRGCWFGGEEESVQYQGKYGPKWIGAVYLVGLVGLNRFRTSGKT